MKVSSILLVVACLSSMLTPTGATKAATNPAHAAIDSSLRDQFSDDLRRVTATRDTSDDLALAERLIETADGLEDMTATATMLYDNAYNLAWRLRDGLDVATTAIARLETLRPREAASCRAMRVQLFDRRYASFRGDKKTIAAEALYDVLSKSFDAALKDQFVDEAGKYLLRWQSVARFLKWPEYQTRVAIGRRQLIDRRQAQKQVTLLERKLKENPWNAVAVRELVRLNLIELGHPFGASEMANRSPDALANRLLPLLIEPVERLTFSHCMALADWHEALMAEATDSGELHGLERVAFYRGLALERAGIQLPNLAEAIVKQSEAQSQWEAKRLSFVDHKLGRTVTLYWISDTVADVYLNGRPIIFYSEGFRTRVRDEQRVVQQRKIILKRGDVFTVGLNGAGRQAIALAAVDLEGNIVWRTDPQTWKGYEPPDIVRWYQPKLALRLKATPVEAAKPRKLHDLVSEPIVPVLLKSKTASFLFSVVAHVTLPPEGQGQKHVALGRIR